MENANIYFKKMSGIVRFISDLHFSHTNLIIGMRGFASIEEHDEYIISQWNKVVGKKDVTYILGDLTMEKKSPYSLLDRLNGLKHVILGNHDRLQDVPELLKHVHSVSGCINYKGLMLTHIPIIESEIMGHFYRNIHGHIHKDKIQNDRYVNVSCEAVGYTPKTLLELGVIIPEKLIIR